MNTKFFILGSVLLLVIGSTMVLYMWNRLSAVRKLKRRMLVVPVTVMGVRIVSVEKVSRFRWIEFSPLVQYRYKFGNHDYVSERLYLDGDVSYKNQRDAAAQLIDLERISSIYCDPLNPELSVVYCDVAPPTRANFHGVFGAGVMVMASGLILLGAKIFSVE